MEPTIPTLTLAGCYFFLTWRDIMGNAVVYLVKNLVLALTSVFLFSTVSFAEDIFGGLTFVGDREGVCIEISGECVREDILFELNTCDTNNAVKEKFKDRMPFTILVPKGSHELVIKKDGKQVAKETISIKPEEVLEYKLP